MLKLLFTLIVAFASLNTSAQTDSMFILKGNAYFSNEDFGYPDSSLHGRLCWYSNILHENNEPVLFNLSTKNTIYRFTHINRFGNGYSIRLEKNDSTYTLFIADYKETIEKKLDRFEAKEFEKRLKRCRFWKMPTRKDPRGRDCALWIFEGVQNSEYHVVDRSSPKKRSSYRKMCQYLKYLTL